MPHQLSFPGFGGRSEPALLETDCVLFMAYPGAEDARRLAELAEELRREHGLSGRPLTSNRFHVSLHFVGYVAGEPPRGFVSILQKAASEVSMAPFAVSFDRAMSFQRPGKRPFVLLGGEGVEALKALQRALRGAMKRIGLARGALTTPHMTLLYDRRNVAERAVRPVRWTVRELTLVRSRRGYGQHIPLARLPLRNSPLGRLARRVAPTPQPSESEQTGP